MPEGDHEYDIAVSFSGKQRPYVERVVRACQEHGVKTFYDKDEAVRLWGTNVIPQLRRVYGGVAARYVVPFLSQDYLAGPYPMDEFSTAMRADVERGGGYILPVLMDDVQVPPEILNPAVIYIEAGERSPEQLAELIVEKVGVARRKHQEPRDVSRVVEDAVRFRLPRIAPNSFSAQETLNAALDRVGQLFKRAANELTQYGLICTVRTSDMAVRVLVEERGKPVCELSLRDGDGLWGGRLVLNFAWPRVDGSVANGFVTATWDKSANEARLVLDDFSLGRPQKPTLTVDELFAVLWEKIVEFIECRA
ncbi:toll/interleukin-1 receptor domain-containing protein [Amycolatopsis japonica]|uniref:toll/interleukin-1 receptor domain-containing protein n=1 Tax=Amycolatopsis japonica TaxID=208439 RepID=UPI00332FF2A8